MGEVIKAPVNADIETAKAHLYALFKPFADMAYEGKIEIRCIHPISAITTPMNFGIKEVDAAAQYAIDMNEEYNVYVGVNPRNKNTKGAGKATDVEISYFHFVDADDTSSVEKLKTAPLKPNFVIETGREPNQRVHAYWRLEDPSRNLQQWQKQQEALADYFGGDRVIDPPRIMRLAGTVSHPSEKKLERGYKKERVRYIPKETRPPVEAEALRQTYVTDNNSPELSAEPTFEIDTGRVGRADAQIQQMLEATKQAGEWHNNMLRVVATLVGRNYSDFLIGAVCAPYCDGGAADPDLTDLIKTARQKWQMPDPGEAEVDLPEPVEELKIKPIGNFDASKLPRRQFLYGKHYIRKYVSATVSPGGVGKTMLSMTDMVAIATGRQLLHDDVVAAGNTLHINLEDPMDELIRRLAAICIKHNVSHSEIAESVFLHSGRDRRVVVADKRADGGFIAMPDAEALKEQIIENNIVAMSIDPFVKVHYLDENDNKQIDFALQILSDIAGQTGCAIDVVHHVRKAPTGVTAAHGDINQARGASALAGAVRAARTLAQMSQTEAASFGLSEMQAIDYLRIDNAKSNMAPLHATRWLRRLTVDIGNGDELDPGDSVGALEIYTPPDAWDGINDMTVNSILDLVDAAYHDGTEGDGKCFTETKRNKARWVGQAIQQIVPDKSDAACKNIIRQWMENGILIEVEKPNRQQAKGLKVGLRPTVNRGNVYAE